MTKVFLILLMFGTHANTGDNVSKAGIFQSYSTMQECMEGRKVLLKQMEQTLDKNGWITGQGKVKVERFNASCDAYTEVNA